MSLTLLDAATEAACAAAPSQQSWLELLAAPWGGGDVTVRILGSGSTLRETLTIAPWTVDAGTSPRRLVCGARSARTHASTGDIASIVFRAGSTDICSLDAGVTGSGASVTFAGVIKALCAPDVEGVYLQAPGALPATYVPAWASSVASETWVQIPGNTLSDIDPGNDSDYTATPGSEAWRGTGGIGATMTSWNGACHDPILGRMFLCGEGGHTDHAGNAVYVWEIMQETPAWRMILPPSGAIGQPSVSSYNDGQEASGVYSDGRPRSWHGYNGHVWVPRLGPVMAGQTAQHYSGVIGPRRVVKFDPDTGEATFGSAATATGNGSSIAACYDPTRGSSGSIWRRWHGTAILERYDIAADTWTQVGSSQAYNGACSLTYLSGHDCILLGNGDSASQSITGGFAVIDCVTGTYHTPTFTGAPALNTAHNGGLWPGRCQPIWLESKGYAVAWSNATNRTQILRLTPGANPRTDAWAVDTLPVSVSNTHTPSAAQANGTHGRFGYWAEADALYLVNAATQQGSLYRI